MRPRCAIKNKAAAVLHSPAPRARARLIIAFILMWPGAKCYTQRQKKSGAREKVREQPQEGGGWARVADLRPAMRFTISRPGRPKYFQTDGVRARRNKCTFNGLLRISPANCRPRPLIQH